MWWDRQLHPGERFSAEIERALKGADAVVALWSKASIESAWVQDEAGVGRDSGRLVPALLEPVTPPLGFRQYHAVDLSRKRLDTRSTQPLVQAVEDRLSGKRTVTEVSARAKPLIRSTALLTLGLLLLLSCIAAGWWFLRPGGTSSPSIVIEAADRTSPMAEMASRSIADELGRFGAGPLAGLDIKTPGQQATYLAKTSVLESPSKFTLQLSLGSHRADNLWSATLAGASNQMAELNRQAAAMLGAALQCDLDVEEGHYPHITTDIRALYVDGCARLADPRTSRNEAINALRQVTQKAPRFAPGWAKLSYAEFSGLDFVPESEASNLAWSAGRHSAAARQLDPTIPESYYVRAFDRNWGRDSNAEALGILDEGLHENPESALLNGGRAEVLLRIGRIAESLESAKRAVALNPLSPTLLEAYVLGLAYAGQTKAAERELKTAEEAWPRSAAIAALRYMFDLRYGDPVNALRMLQEDEVPEAAADERTELFLRARIKPTAANIETSLRLYRESVRKNWWNVMGYVQALGEFDRVDEAYRAIAAAPVEPWYRNGDILFRPFMKDFRHDRRFMQLAYRAGLLSFWRKSGVWPDFCKDPQLPYDCRQEAKKFPLEPPPA